MMSSHVLSVLFWTCDEMCAYAEYIPRTPDGRLILKVSSVGCADPCRALVDLCRAESPEEASYNGIFHDTSALISSPDCQAICFVDLQTTLRRARDRLCTRLC